MDTIEIYLGLGTNEGDRTGRVTQDRLDHAPDALASAKPAADQAGVAAAQPLQNLRDRVLREHSRLVRERKNDR